MTSSSPISTYWSVTKPRISLMVNFVAVASLILAGGINRLDILAILIISGVLAVAGAGSFNNYLDRDLDAAMVRTKKRPLPAGKITPAKKVLFMGFILSISSILISWQFINVDTSFFIGLGLFTYVVIYTLWLKRRHSSNIVLGGFAGSAASLAGWSAIQSLTIVPILMALVIFLWTPSHFWALALKLREDYAKVKLPMLPSLNVRKCCIIILLNTVILVSSSLILFFLGGKGAIYLIAAILSGSIMIWTNLKMLSDPSQKNLWNAYKFSSTYLIIFLVALIIDSGVRGSL